MENNIDDRNNGVLLLTRYTFKKVLNSIIEHFKLSNNIDKYRDSQLYGFGNYDPKKPNLKNDLELIMKGYVNGKYLYNKLREAASGKPVIKLSREYKSVFFNYLGYKGIYDFLEEKIIKNEEKKKQLQLLKNLSSAEEFYYVIYYYGEDRKMTKGQMTIHNNWKTFDLVFVYQNIKKEPVLYDLFGVIKQENNFVHFDCKYFMEGKKIKGSQMIFYVGKASQNERAILIGAYSSFDKYDHSISGKIMIKQMNSKLEMEEESQSTIFDPAICQELVKYRFIIPSHLPKKLSRLSLESPYASIFGKLPNKYTATFSVNNNAIKLLFQIQQYHFNVISDMEDIELEKDRISIESKGQVLELHFNIIGIFLLQKVSIYLSVYELFAKEKKSRGQFSGIDINNNIVSGNVLVEMYE